MSITPEQIAHKSFSMTLRRGYDKDEVDRWLAELAEEYAKLQRASLRPSTASDAFEALGEEVARVLRTAREAADVIVDDARRKAEELHRASSEEAARIRRDADNQLVRSRAAAEQEMHRMVEGARREAAEMLARAEREAAEIMAAAEESQRRLQEHERSLRTRLDAIESSLQALRADMAFEHHAEGDDEMGDPGRTEAGAAQDVTDDTTALRG